MTDQSKFPIPRFASEQYGFVNFEGETIPCTFGGEPGEFTALIMLQGICQAIGMPIEDEITRIQNHHLLRDGLFLVPFQFISPNGKIVERDVPAISLTRLHTWLAMIPPETVSDGIMRQKFENMQRELTDMIYRYFGRRLLPQEIRDEDDRYIDDAHRQVYEKIEEAGQLSERLAAIEGEFDDLKQKVERLSISISAGEEGDSINADQQEQLKAMIDILGHQYEQKHGKGTRGELIAGLKARHNFRFYNSVPKSSWKGLVRECITIYRQLYPKGTELPRVFEMAEESISQDRLF
jgi:hypothetical protein